LIALYALAHGVALLTTDADVHKLKKGRVAPSAPPS